MVVLYKISVWISFGGQRGSNFDFCVFIWYRRKTTLINRMSEQCVTSASACLNCVYYIFMLLNRNVVQIVNSHIIHFSQVSWSPWLQLVTMVSVVTTGYQPAKVHFSCHSVSTTELNYSILGSTSLTSLWLYVIFWEIYLTRRT